jgi:hypothetical protein
MRQALHLDLAIAGVLQGALQMVCQGADMAVRAARGDDQAVGEGALALDVDADDVGGLVLVQLGEDQLFEGPDVPIGGLRRLGGRQNKSSWGG